MQENAQIKPIKAFTEQQLLRSDGRSYLEISLLDTSARKVLLSGLVGCGIKPHELEQILRENL